MSVLSGRRLAVLDLETTGWSPALGHTVVEVARVTLEDGEIRDEWSSLVGPRRTIPSLATRVHGITEAMLAGAPTPREVGPIVRGACGHLPLVFHNAAFDLPFLRGLLRTSGVPPLYNPVIDTLGLARVLLGSGNKSLPVLAARLGLPPERPHRALGDARTTARLLLALAARWEGERGAGSLAQLAAASQDAQRELTHRAAQARHARALAASRSSPSG